MFALSQAPSSDPSPPRDEVALIRDAQEAQPGAFDELVRRHSTRIFSFLLHLTRHRQDAEDLTQQTFLKAYRNLHRFDCRRPLLNWLFTIARRTALNHFRATQRWEIIPEDLASSEPTPAHTAEQHDRHASLWARARSELSEREFEVLWLRCVEEMSTDDTAHVMGLTRIHVKVLLHRARQRLLKGDT